MYMYLTHQGWQPIQLGLRQLVRSILVLHNKAFAALTAHIKAPKNTKTTVITTPA